jgi:hypothetical protein
MIVIGENEVHGDEAGSVRCITTLKGVRETIVAVENQCYIFSMQGACAIHLSVTCLAVPYFSTSHT